MNYVHYVAGGGLGDVVRELLYNGALGILKRWKLRHPQDRLKVVTMSHNPSHRDLFFGQDWIDGMKCCRFPLELGWKPEMFYDWYETEFVDHKELRFTLNEKKSLYRVDLMAQRSKLVPIENIPPVGMAVDVVLTQHERQIVEHHADMVVIHPFGGEVHKWFSDDVARAAIGAAGDKVVVVGADYERPGHFDEAERAATLGITLRTFPPRVLLEIVRRARAVVGAESSVYYMAAMWGRPVAMLWPPAGTYDLVKRGTSNWDWYFGEGEPDNLFLPLSSKMESAHIDALVEWIRTKAG